MSEALAVTGLILLAAAVSAAWWGWHVVTDCTWQPVAVWMMGYC